GAAAHALGAVARHLDEVDAAERTDDAARREVDVVVAAGVAGVVGGEALFGGPRGGGQPAAGDELGEQGPVVEAHVHVADLGAIRGYWFLITLKQCGHCVMIFCTPMPLNVSTFCIASIWKMYSFPERRAWSPLHTSLGPRIAKSMPGRCSNLASDRLAFLLRS